MALGKVVMIISITPVVKRSTSDKYILLSEAQIHFSGQGKQNTLPSRRCKIRATFASALISITYD